MSGRPQLILVIIAALALITPQAAADPLEREPRSSFPSGWSKRVTYSNATVGHFKKGGAIVTENVRRNGRTRLLDYRVAKAKFSAISNARQYAAGWLASGGRLEHISDYERRKVGWHYSRHFRASCTGVTKFRHNRDWKWDHWSFYNSCRTTTLIRSRRDVGIIVGVIGALVGAVSGSPVTKLAGVSVGASAAVTALDANSLEAARDRSPVRGIVIASNHVSTRAGLTTVVKWRPQWRNE